MDKFLDALKVLADHVDQLNAWEKSFCSSCTEKIERRGEEGLGPRERAKIIELYMKVSK